MKNLCSHPGWYDLAFWSMGALPRPRTDEEKATARLMKIGSQQCKERGNYSSTARQNTPSGTKQEGDKLLLPSFPPVGSAPLYFYTLYSLPSICSRVSFRRLGRSRAKLWLRKTWDGGRERQTAQTDGIGQRQSICASRPGKGTAGEKREKKGAGVGRRWVPSRDREQKGEGCGPDQVGAA